MLVLVCLIRNFHFERFVVDCFNSFILFDLLKLVVQETFLYLRKVLITFVRNVIVIVCLSAIKRVKLSIKYYILLVALY